MKPAPGAPVAPYHLPPQHFAEVLTALRAEGGGGGHERRQVTRVDVQAAVAVAPLVNGVPGDEFRVLTRDVSIGGMGLLYRTAVAAGELLVVRLPRTHKKPPLVMVCAVTHCRPLADGIFGVGLEFKRELLTDQTDRAAEIATLSRQILA